MLKGLGSRLTYANVMATVAVFLALGGGAYALTGIPDRGGVFHGCASNATGVLRVVKSASSCQKSKTVLRNGKRVRLPGEFAVAWNQQGRPGVQGVSGVGGVQGVSGVQGQKGDTGPTGPSDIHVVGVADATLSTSGATEVASLTVPAGSYLIGASLEGAKQAPGSTAFDCRLADALSGMVTVWDQKQTTMLTDAAPNDTLSLSGADTFTAPKTIKVTCSAVAVATIAVNTRLWAINAGSLHATLPLPLD